ncbi:MAG TPA: hypothetical protein VK891_13060 [Euzebyales bacterium]|nr:hypothetical protein [Euzebyales bacterium]
MAASTAVVVLLAGCGEDPVDPTEQLAAACAEAEEVLADAPAPTDGGSQRAFVEAAGEAVDVVADTIAEVDEQIDEQALRDLARQLGDFPRETAQGEALRVANEASAAIVRIDRFASALDLSECEAGIWRPDDWRTLANRANDDRDVDEVAFRQQLDDLCARTFPNPALLVQGTPLLPALIGEEEGGENVTLQLLQRLNSLNNTPADAGRFFRDFADELPEIQPSSNLEDEYVSLVAAFIGVEAAVPRVVPRNPSPEVRNQVDAAFEELERAWADLDVRCG